MKTLRHHIHRRLCWATVLIVAALLLEMLVPVGYMPAMASGTFHIQPCPGRNVPFASIVEPSGADGVHGEHANDRRGSEDGTSAMHCIFSSLSAPALGTVDPIQLALAIIFIFASATHFEAMVVRWRDLHLRPPSQGPPLV